MSECEVLDVNPGKAYAGQADCASDMTSASTDESLYMEENVAWWDRYHSAINLITIFIYISIGIVVITKFEGWHPLTSIYVIVQIVTTIGFGDITVQRPESQWFMTVYVIVGIIVVANIINEFLNDSVEVATDAMRRRIRWLQQNYLQNFPRHEAAQALARQRNLMLSAVIIYLGFLAAGVIFYSYFEACTCSYGATKLPDCIEGERCEETGGYTKNFRNALYMSVITLSTTGFGDLSPKTKFGRIFGIVWMTLGVISWVNVIAKVLTWWHTLKKVRRRKHLHIKLEDFTCIDTDADGRISRSEFQIYLLLKEGIVQWKDLAVINAFFDTIDADSNGFLNQAEVAKAMGEAKLSYNYIEY